MVAQFPTLHVSPSEQMQGTSLSPCMGAFSDMVDSCILYAVYFIKHVCLCACIDAFLSPQDGGGKQ